jgi:CRP-like cAMP-binding protein
MDSGALLQALFFGLISAVSLPLGAIAARLWVPSDRVLAALMAFGAGALLSALTIDLVGDALEEGEFFSLAGGAVLGGALFVVLNQLVNKKGGFLRKSATTFRYLRRLKAKKLQDLFKSLSETPFFTQLPAEEIAALVPCIDSRSYPGGATIIREGDPGDSLFIVESGRIQISTGEEHRQIAVLTEGDLLGEMALVTGAPRSASAVAQTDCRVWIVLKEDFDRALATSPHLADSVSKLATERIASLKEKEVIAADEADRWFRKARRTVDEELLLPSATEIREAAGEHAGAPMAIWLGILLDGIPESLVIGSSLVHSTISLSLIAGLFFVELPRSPLQFSGNAPGKLHLSENPHHVDVAAVVHRNWGGARQDLLHGSNPGGFCPRPGHCGRGHADNDCRDHVAGGVPQGRGGHRDLNIARLPRGNILQDP